MQEIPYAIVGAGPSGLCMARWFAAEGVPCRVFERASDIGGLWDISRPDTPLYDSCHFISSKTLSAFRDSPMPAGHPDYPRHDQVLGYLQAYAERHGVRPLVSFGAEVREAAPEKGGWRVRVSPSRGAGETLSFAGVVAANGHNWEPRMPQLAGRFDGELLHARDYPGPAALRDRRVLVVGGGNSGCDIAVDASLHARRAWISLRRGYHFIPKHVFGAPADVFAHRGPRLPARLAQPVFEGLLRLLLGDLRRYGLPRPDHRIFETHPIVNTQILHALAHGDLAVKPDVRELRGRRVAFADGSEEEPDLILLATGYVPAIPFLAPGIYRPGDRSELYLNVFHRRLPELFVIGLFENDGAAFPLIDRQCELVAKLVRARRERPAAAAAFARRMAGPPPDFSGGVRHLALERMSTYVMTAPYTRELERLLRAL